MKWEEPAEPMKIAGSIHFVGTKSLGVWLITGSEGHILLNTGMPSSGPMIEASIRKLGFRPEDIKLLLTCHAHVDHVGGHAYMEKISGAQAIRSAVSLYGPTEMAMLYRSSASRDFVQKVTKQYIGSTPEDFPERYRTVSPLHRINAQTPPTIAFHGTSDRAVPVDQTIALDQALVKAGVAHETYLLPGTDHGFDIDWGGFATQIARAKIEDFLKSTDGIGNEQEAAAGVSQAGFIDPTAQHARSPTAHRLDWRGAEPSRLEVKQPSRL
jgi:ribonuclease BN (tRNA processing enzyme)